jgi:opacity protein-like surface antigen
VRLLRCLAAVSVLLVLTARPARADGFITPFLGYNFGGDSGNCQSLTNCTQKRANFGVSFGSMGSALGFEEDVSYARNFFGEMPGLDNSVFSAMSNLLIGSGVGPVRPYVVGGLGLIRPHVSSLSGALTTVSLDNNAFGYDIGGGVGIFPAKHIGFRGDIRRFHTLQAIDLPVFTAQKLNFWRASVGLALSF